MRILATIAVASLLLLLAPAARAGGGPENVLIIANGRSPESLAVANAYRAARDVPEANVCLLDIPLDDFRSRSIVSRTVYDLKIAGPIEDFLRHHPAAGQLQFFVLCPDLPLRVESGPERKPFSLAAVLALLGSSAPFGTSPANPYCGQQVAFEKRAGQSGRLPVIHLVTWLRGYERSDALALIQRSLKADGTAPPGTFYFVKSQHTRGYEQAADALRQRGLAVRLAESGHPVAAAPDVAAYLSGGEYSGLGWKDLASNTYRPGCLIDMLESYGALWNNWRTFGYNLQTPVAWFIRAGATGVHGTTDEPFAAAFPSSGRARLFLDNYTRGLNLAEAFWSAIPQLGWQNAVFGDPLCAPYAVRGKVTLTVTAPEAPSTIYNLAARVEPAPSTTPAEVRFFLDGRLLDPVRPAKPPADGGAWTAEAVVDTLKIPDGWHRLRAVAVDDSPAAVQSFAAADFQTRAAGNSLLLSLAAGPTAAPLAAGDRISLTALFSGQSAPRAITLAVGPRKSADFAADKLLLDTALLGPGRHQLRAVARGPDGAVVALSNSLALDLVEPLHVVEQLPVDKTGRRPMFLLRYNDKITFSAAEVRAAIRLTQADRAVAVRCSIDGRNLIVESSAPLEADVPCRLLVAFPQAVARSTDVDRTFAVTNDPKFLYALPPDAMFTEVIEGLAQGDAKSIGAIEGRPAKVVLGPVDLFSPRRPAAWSLPAFDFSATLNNAAPPSASDTGGVGLGVLYSDIENYCRVRVERDTVTVVQILAGRESRLAAWPAAGPTTGAIPMLLEVRGPELAVTVWGKRLGQVQLDLKLPPGLPLIDLGLPHGASATAVKVSRP
jgi:uncharacterized protein (TIGR03790 family)